MIFIKTIILYYYNLDVKEIIKEEKDKIIFISDNNEKYIFEKIEVNNVKINSCVNNNKLFHTPQFNKNRSIISEWNRENYALLKINIKDEDRNITLNDLVMLSSIRVPFNIENKEYYYQLWSKKLIFISKFLSDKYEKEYYDYSYYLYLGKNALKILKTIDFSNITFGLCFNRFEKNNTLYLLYDPFKVKIGPVVNSFSEFIKYTLFKKEKEESIDFILSLEFTKDDLLFLISRLLFPTYYYDLFLHKKFENQYYTIVNNQRRLFEIIKKIIKKIKKRYIIKDISMIEQLINQL